MLNFFAQAGCPSRHPTTQRQRYGILRFNVPLDTVLKKTEGNHAHIVQVIKRILHQKLGVISTNIWIRCRSRQKKLNGVVFAIIFASRN